MRAPAIFFALLAMGLACASEFNTVRLSKPSSEIERLTLRTQHYLRTDDNHVQELDRGERRAELRATRNVTKAGDTEEWITLTLRLYDDDPAPVNTWKLEADSGLFSIAFSEWKTDELHEKVTVLDTGQRTSSNGALASEVQAQTGYITFGKPTAAGSVERAWRIYSARAILEDNLRLALAGASRLKLAAPLGSMNARVEFRPEQIKAWNRYGQRTVDEVVDRAD